MAEEWRPVVGYEGLYEVSDQGRVRSWWKRKTTPRLLRPTPNEHGYGVLTLCSGGGQNKKWLVHVLVLEAFVGPRPPGYLTRHIDGNPAHNTLPNLAWGTYSENEHDKVRHGTHNWSSRTHCPSGHPYDEANTYVIPLRGSRLCRACHAQKRREKRAAQRQAAVA